MRNLKTLGRALAVVLAIGAIGASAAQAATNFTFGAGATKVKITQANQNQLFLTAGETNCTGTAVGEGTTAGGTQSSITFTPEFSGCESLGRPADIKAEGGCVYRLKATGTLEVCPTGGSITWTVTSSPGISLCTIHVWAQNIEAGIALANSAGSPMDVTATAEVAGLTYTTTGGGGSCGVANTEFHCGEYEGKITLKAFNSPNAQVDLTTS